MEPVTPRDATSTQTFQEKAQTSNTARTENSGTEAIKIVASEVLKNGANAAVELRGAYSHPTTIAPAASNGMDFLEQYINATSQGIRPSREEQDWALRDLEARMAAAVVDPQEALHDKELAAAEKSIVTKSGSRAAIHSQSRRDMVNHFALGKKAIIIAESLGASVDPDKKINALKWPTQKPYQPNSSGSVQQLDDIMTCAVKSLMSQLKIPVPNTDTWEGLKPELHKLLLLNPPVFPDQTTLQNYNLPRLFAVYDDDLPKWLVALALTAVAEEINLQNLFPKTQEALQTNDIKSVKPEAYELIKGMNERSSIPTLMKFIELVLKPNLEISVVLLK